MKHAFIRVIASNIACTVYLIFFTTVVGYKLIVNAMPFFDWDESIYVEVGNEMVNKMTLIPQWQGQPWLEKPFLAPLVYGLTLHLPFMPEVTTRLLSLGLSVIALILVYAWIEKVTANKMVALLTVLITSTNALFLQRSQIVNTDVFLLIGWLGYLLTFPNFAYSLLFLTVGVLSKSVLGFYPLILLAMVELYQLVTTKKYKKSFVRHMKVMLIQVGLLFLCYVIMFVLFCQTFIHVHFAYHLLRLVTQSL